MLEYVDMNKVIKKVKEITNGIIKPIISEKGKKIGSLLKEMGYTRNNLRRWVKLFSEIIGEPVEVVCDNKRMIGTMLVPLRSINGHNYKLNEPVLVDSSTSNMLRMNGTVGNNLTVNDTTTRKATDIEIDTFFRCFDYICGKIYMINFLKHI